MIPDGYASGPAAMRDGSVFIARNMGKRKNLPDAGRQVHGTMQIQAALAPAGWAVING